MVISMDDAYLMDRLHLQCSSIEEDRKKQTFSVYNYDATTEILGPFYLKRHSGERCSCRKIEGKRDHGKQRLSYLSSIGTYLERKTEEIMHKARNRGNWTPMMAIILFGQGT